MVRQIPALGNKSPLLTIPEVYRQPRGGVNLREKLPDVKQKPFLTTVRTPDPGKPALRVAAVEITLDHLLDDRPEIPVILLEAIFIVGEGALLRKIKSLYETLVLRSK